MLINKLRILPVPASLIGLSTEPPVISISKLPDIVPTFENINVVPALSFSVSLCITGLKVKIN